MKIDRDKIAESAQAFAAWSSRNIGEPVRAYVSRNRKQLRVVGRVFSVCLILFSAFKVTDERKGFRYLAEALRIIQGSPHPVALVVVGRQAESLVRLLPPAVGEWGGVFTIPYISDERLMAQLYAAADVFVTPSLEDNLPNTIAEAMSTGTPCVGFDVGGIPEMIDHKQNGYVARRCDARDLAAGIEFCLTNDLRAQALRKATQTYNESSVARQYIALYESE